MNNWQSILVTALLLLCGCKSTTIFSPSQIEPHTTGQDPEFKEMAGIPVWVTGKPNRPFVTIGVIVDRKFTRIENYEYSEAMERIARLAKKKKAEGVIIISRVDPPPVPPEQPAEPEEQSNVCDDDSSFFGEILGELMVGLVKGLFACFVSPGYDRIPFEVTAVPIKFTDTNAPTANYPSR